MLIENLEERTNHQAIRDKMAEDGYSFEEVDKAMRALGEIAHYDLPVAS